MSGWKEIDVAPPVVEHKREGHTADGSKYYARISKRTRDEGAGTDILRLRIEWPHIYRYFQAEGYCIDELKAVADVVIGRRA